jgi:hypothetical protein
MKEVQATGEAFSTKKRTSSTEISSLFYFSNFLDLASWNQIRIQPTTVNADPDLEHC